MKRWKFLILLCLLLGIVTTVGVAWGFALIARSLPVFNENGIRSTAVGVSARWSTTSDIAEVYGVLSDIEFGVPCRAFTRHISVQKIMSSTNFDNSAQTINKYFLSGQATLDDYILSLEVVPIFPGFLINTLFYAVIWFGLFFGISAGRRAHRSKRGRCPMCAYDLRGNQSRIEPSALSTPLDSQAGRLRHQIKGCPECGWNRKDAE